MKHGTVYAIRNTITERQYIGQTMKGVETRWRSHRSLLGLGRHPARPLQAEWDTSGEAAFTLTILEDNIDPDLIGERELFWMKAALANGVALYNQMTGEVCAWCGAALKITARTNCRRRYCAFPASCSAKGWRAKRRRRPSEGEPT